MSNEARNAAGDDEATGPSKKMVGSAVIVAVIVALGLVLTVTNLMGGKAEPKNQTTTSASPSASSEAGASPTATGTADVSVCGLKSIQMSGTVSSAPPAAWSLVGTTAAPSIKDQGPGKIDEDGYRSCFARTPTGALVAAANYVALGSHGPVRKKFYTKATVPGPGRDALLRTPIPGAEDSGTRIQIAGFRILNYTGKTADVDIAFKTSNGANAAMVLNLQWVEGDWKLRLADDGTELSPVEQLPTLAGYVPWSGA